MISGFMTFRLVEKYPWAVFKVRYVTDTSVAISESSGAHQQSKHEDILPTRTGWMIVNCSSPPSPHTYFYSILSNLYSMSPLRVIRGGERYPFPPRLPDRLLPPDKTSQPSKKIEHKKMAPQFLP